jgi:hypothetical protein
VRAGLLSFDDNKHKTLETKVNEAVAAYRAKPRFAGKTPDTCYVHASTLPEGQKAIQLDGVRVAAAATIPPHHFFIGVENVDDNGRDRPKWERKQSKRSKP